MAQVDAPKSAEWVSGRNRKAGAMTGYKPENPLTVQGEPPPGMSPPASRNSSRPPSSNGNRKPC
jgi:hypothetical protein